MAPKRKAASKPKKNEPINVEDMPHITVRRPLKNNSKDQNDESKDQKDEEHEVLPSKIYFSEKSMNPKVIVEKMSTDVMTHLLKVEPEEVVKLEDPDKKSVLKKNVFTKVTKPESKKQTFGDGKESKKTRKRAASDDRLTNKIEEKVVSGKSKKKPVDKDISEPSDSHSIESRKRNRRAASVDILNKNSSSALEPKKLRKANKGTVETTENLIKRHRRSSSLDIVSPERLTEEPIKNCKAVVESVDDKSKKNTKVMRKKVPKVYEKNKKGEKYTNEVLVDEKDDINLHSLENVNAEETEDVKSTKESIDEVIEVEDVIKKVPNQLNSKSRGKRQAIQKQPKSKQIKSLSEESCKKSDTDNSDNMSESPEVKPKVNDKEQADEILETKDGSELKQINNKKKGKRQEKKYTSKSKQGNSSEDNSGKTDLDDSDQSKTPEKTQKLEKGQKYEFTEEQDKILVDDNSEKIFKQINSRSRGKEQKMMKKHINGKSASEDSDMILSLPPNSKPNKMQQLDEPSDEEDLKLVEDISEKIPKQINSKSRGKRQAVQKHISKSNKSPEESNLKSNTDDSDMTNSPEIKPKRIGRGKQINVDQEIKLPKRQVRNKVKPDYYEGEENLDVDKNLINVDILVDHLDNPESEKNLVPTKIKRKAKPKSAKK